MDINEITEFFIDNKTIIKNIFNLGALVPLAQTWHARISYNS